MVEHGKLTEAKLILTEKAHTKLIVAIQKSALRFGIQRNLQRFCLHRQLERSLEQVLEHLVGSGNEDSMLANNKQVVDRLTQCSDLSEGYECLHTLICYFKTSMPYFTVSVSKNSFEGHLILVSDPGRRATCKSMHLNPGHLS